ncbi:MAG: hypothetical protein HRT44_11820 [Bdellovibrionales bacterium]|nr:hypothetical protein [Bdellovibrionales bacterium]NQZ19927.1 hypothetical protein [Bdellovibrionales bacterium]
MKKIIISVLAISFLGLPTWAQEEGEDLNLPVNVEVQKKGWAVAPIIQCPRINKRYDELLSQLNNIKAQVQNDACKQEELNAVRDVESLETLVGPEREKFLALINKTTSAEDGEDPVELTADEVKDLQNYIDQVVRKTAVVAGFANNPACFDEGQKNSALGTLASVIGEVSGALGAVAGPFGAKLALGGKLVQGVIGSIDKIIQARKTYDFTDYEQEKAYLVSLCAYYDFKPDLEKETNTGEVIYELQELVASSDRLLGQLTEECDSCGDIIADFDRRLEENIPYRFVQGARDAQANTADELADMSSRSITKKVEEMSWIDLMDAYFPLVRVANNAVEVAEGRNGPGLHTIRSLRTRTWALQEIDNLIELDQSSLSDSGRDAVIELQERIEGVLVQHEGPRYVSFLMGALTQRARELGQVVSEVWEAGDSGETG